MNTEKAIAAIALKAEYTQADKIIRYLLNPDDDSVELTPTEMRRYDILKEIHALRNRYQRKGDIATIICQQFDIKERMARKYIADCEHVFGSVEGVHKAYERNFLMESSRKNIELAFASRDSETITKALLAHYKLCGLDEVNVELPDFSALEPNQYEISIPKNQLDMLKKMMDKGVLVMEDLIPHKEIVIDIAHEDLTSGEEEEEDSL